MQRVHSAQAYRKYIPKQIQKEIDQAKEEVRLQRDYTLNEDVHKEIKP